MLALASLSWGEQRHVKHRRSALTLWGVLASPGLDFQTVWVIFTSFPGVVISNSRQLLVFSLYSYSWSVRMRSAEEMEIRPCRKSCLLSSLVVEFWGLSCLWKANVFTPKCLQEFLYRLLFVSSLSEANKLIMWVNVNEVNLSVT